MPVAKPIVIIYSEKSSFDMKHKCSINKQVFPISSHIQDHQDQVWPELAVTYVYFDLNTWTGIQMLLTFNYWKSKSPFSDFSK